MMNDDFRRYKKICGNKMVKTMRKDAVSKWEIIYSIITADDVEQFKEIHNKSDKGVNPNRVDPRNGYDMIHIALIYKSAKCLKFMLNELNAEVCYDHLLEAVKTLDIDLIAIVIEKFNLKTHPTFMFDVLRWLSPEDYYEDRNQANKEIIKLLLSNGMDVGYTKDMEWNVGGYTYTLTADAADIAKYLNYDEETTNEIRRYMV